MPTVVVAEGLPFDRERLLAEFKAAEIDGRVFFWPLSGLAVPHRLGPGGTPVAAAIHGRAVNLPSYHDLDDAGIDRVCEVFTRHLRQATGARAA